MYFHQTNYEGRENPKLESGSWHKQIVLYKKFFGEIFVSVRGAINKQQLAALLQSGSPTPAFHPVFRFHPPRWPLLDPGSQKRTAPSATTHRWLIGKGLTLGFPKQESGRGWKRLHSDVACISKSKKKKKNPIRRTKCGPGDKPRFYPLSLPRKTVITFSGWVAPAAVRKGFIEFAHVVIT